jgi:hypothetical protein
LDLICLIEYNLNECNRFITSYRNAQSRIKTQSFTFFYTKESTEQYLIEHKKEIPVLRELKNYLAATKKKLEELKQ